MNIAIAQIEVIPGNPRENYQTIFNYVLEIMTHGLTPTTSLIVFPELSIPGYLIGDMWEEESFLDDCEYYGDQVARLAKDYKVNIAFGNVACVDDTYSDGRPIKYNALFIANTNGDFITTSELTKHGLWFIPKTLLPNYREFDEPRHFSDLRKLAETSRVDVASFIEPIKIISNNKIDSMHIGFTLCEDGWDMDYPIKPIDILCSKGAQLIVNHSCSPFTVGKNNKRNRVFGAHAKNNKVPLIYVNAIGSQNNGKTIYSFDGCSVLYDNKGIPKYQLPSFEDNYFVITHSSYLSSDGITDKLEMIYTNSGNDRNGNRTPMEGIDCNYIRPLREKAEIEEIYDALVYGIKQYMDQSGLKKVVIGSSGGIDSAVAAALYSKILAPEDILLVNMPSKYNSDTTKNLSAELAGNLGCYYAEVPIGDSVALTKKQIDGLTIYQRFGDACQNMSELALSDFHYENIQARDRSSRILAACASAFGGVFTNNGNKAETTVGYCTIYGDHAGFLAALADLWKEQVYLLGKYINHVSDHPMIPIGIFNIPASAELSEAQSIDGEGDPLKYWYHDKLFRCWVEDWYRKSPFEVLEWYRDGVINERLDIIKDEFGIRRSVYDLFPDITSFCNDLERWWSLFKGMGAAKRIQAPPVLAISKRAFGFDYRECLNGVYFSRKYTILRKLLEPA